MALKDALKIIHFCQYVQIIDDLIKNYKYTKLGHTQMCYIERNMMVVYFLFIK